MNSVECKIGTYRDVIEGALLPVATKGIYLVNTVNQKAHNAVGDVLEKVNAFKKGEYGISNLFYDIGSTPVGKTAMCVFPLALYAGTIHSHLSDSETAQNIYRQLLENDSEIMAAGSVGLIVKDNKMLVALAGIGGLALFDATSGGNNIQYLTQSFLDGIGSGGSSGDIPLQVVENLDLPANAIVGDPHIKEAFFGGYNVEGDIENNRFVVENQGNMNINPDDDVKEMVGILEEGGKGIVYMDMAAGYGAKVIIHDGIEMIAQFPLPGVEPLAEEGVLRAELDLQGLVNKYELTSDQARIVVRNIKNYDLAFVRFHPN
ncbi:MAG: hypothetical protein KAJ91_01835 [Candidatus Aenigmarchaeota archaeon]|nr:hypothetical protein [Candidatus Aenigmarchaeota archaeon]